MTCGLSRISSGVPLAMMRPKFSTAMPSHALMVTHNLRYAVEYGDRLLMLHHGQIVLDKAGEEKAKVTTEGLLEVFNRYSIL